MNGAALIPAAEMELFQQTHCFAISPFQIEKRISC